MTSPKLGVAARIMAGLAILTLITATGGALAVYSFNQFRESFDRVASTQLGTMAAAAQLEQESQALAGLAPDLFVKGLSTGALLAFNTDVYGQQVSLRQLIQQLRDHVGETESVTRISSASENLFRNVDLLSTVIFAKAGAEGELNAAIARMARLYGDALAAITAGDASGEADRELKDPAEIGGATAWLGEMGRLAAVTLDVLSARRIDQMAPIEAEAALLLRSAESSARAAAVQFEALTGFDDKVADELIGERGIVSLRRQLMDLEGEARRLLDDNDSMSRELVAAVEALVTAIRSDIEKQNTTLGHVLSSRSQAIAVLGALGLVSALVIAG
ncbi:MAG: hypothetical protein R3322_21785, partial [Kiloniellales bacterium]|nr:hypothetical protein [Kiloniellales bacterium]